MPGPIQSVERAARLLQALAVASGPLALGELAALVELPKPTVHGLVRTLVGAGLVGQDTATGRYAVVADALAVSGSPDPHWLRSRAMNWTDRLAARTGQAVELGVVSAPSAATGGTVEIAHHVFRPDGSRQRLSTGERQPLHATALGHVLLALAPAAPALRSLRLDPFGSSTPVDHRALAARLVAVRRAGHAVEAGTYRPERAAVAVPVRGRGLTTVAALAVVGASQHLLDGSQRPLAPILVHLREAADAVSAALAEP